MPVLSFSLVIVTIDYCNVTCNLCIKRHKGRMKPGHCVKAGAYRLGSGLRPIPLFPVVVTVVFAVCLNLKLHALVAVIFNYRTAGSIQPI